MPKRIIYVDHMSQPSRAIIIFARANGIELEEKRVTLSKGEHLSKEYRAINPLGKVPCYEEEGFVLVESAAILRYLATTCSVPDHWYPAEPRARARVDSALDWHHGNIRRGCATLCFNRVLAVNMGRPKDDKAAEEAEKLLASSMKMMELYWLKWRRFVSGDKISIADVLMVTELDMLHVLAGASEGKSMRELLEPFPVVREWMQRVAESTAPHHTDASKLLMRAAAKFAERKAQAHSKM